MRICHFIEATGGGSARIAAQLAAGQVALGHEVTMLYSPLRADALFIQAINNITGLNCVAFPMERAVGLHDVNTFLQLCRFLYRSAAFDIIHSHSSKAGALARFAGIVFRKPVQIYSPHAFYSMAPGTSRIYGWYEKLLSWLCEGIITVSPFEKKHAIKDLGISPQKLHVVINGVDMAWNATRDSARAQAALPADTYVVGFVGRLVAQKNPQRLVDTFTRISSQLPDAQLVILGDGVLQGVLEEAIAKNGLTQKTKLLSGYDARNIMPAFDCLLCTSDYEGFAVVFLEALAAGVPIVSTPVGGTYEAIIPGKTGMITADFSPENLAKAVLLLAAMSEREKAIMQQNARDHAYHFTVDIMVNNTLAIYTDALKKR